MVTNFCHCPHLYDPVISQAGLCKTAFSAVRFIFHQDIRSLASTLLSSSCHWWLLINLVQTYSCKSIVLDFAAGTICSSLAGLSVHSPSNGSEFGQDFKVQVLISTFETALSHTRLDPTTISRSVLSSREPSRNY